MQRACGHFIYPAFALLAPPIQIKDKNCEKTRQKYDGIESSKTFT